MSSRPKTKTESTDPHLSAFSPDVRQLLRIIAHRVVSQLRQDQQKQRSVEAFADTASSRKRNAAIDVTEPTSQKDVP